MQNNYRLLSPLYPTSKQYPTMLNLAAVYAWVIYPNDGGVVEITFPLSMHNIPTVFSAETMFFSSSQGTRRPKWCSYTHTTVPWLSYLAKLLW